MKVYHMSDTLQLGMSLQRDYKKNMELTLPFVQALERSEDCFYAMFFNAKYLRAVLGKFGMKDMATNYTKWAVEGVFEYIRRSARCGCSTKPLTRCGRMRTLRLPLIVLGGIFPA